MDNEVSISASYNYAQIDEQGYCFAKSTLSGIVEHKDLILIDEQDVQFGQKYDRENKVWLNEFKPEEPIQKILTLEDINVNIVETKDITSTTQTVTQTTAEDSLLLMELLMVVDSKLDMLLQK